MDGFPFLFVIELLEKISKFTFKLDLISKRLMRTDFPSYFDFKKRSNLLFDSERENFKFLRFHLIWLLLLTQNLFCKSFFLCFPEKIEKFPQEIQLSNLFAAQRETLKFKMKLMSSFPLKNQFKKLLRNPFPRTSPVLLIFKRHLYLLFRLKHNSSACNINNI